MSIQAGARLVQISSSGTAAQRLRQAAGLVGPATAAALLVAWSGLASASAATHLLAEAAAAREVVRLSSPIARTLQLESTI